MDKPETKANEEWTSQRQRQYWIRKKHYEDKQSTKSHHNDEKALVNPSSREW
jgi:hypothetical protein